MNKIKEAFEKWVDSSISIDEIVFISAQDTSERRLKASGFHGGYTSRDAEIEQLKKEKAELETALLKVYGL